MKSRTSIAVAGSVVLSVALALCATAAQQSGATGPTGPSFESTGMILDHHSGRAYRISGDKFKGDEQFTTPVPAGYTPEQIRRAYGLDRVHENGRGQIIGVVIAYENPNVAHDLKHFIRTFDLKEMHGLSDSDSCTVAAGPHPCFEIRYVTGTQPPVDEHAAAEGDLDVQWAHATAPGADILYVVSASTAISDIVQGIDVAGENASVVSMSFGAPEFSGETALDHHFNVPGVSFVAGAGDTGNPGIYPSASPLVLSVGGTTLTLDHKGERTAPETAWSLTGGGISPLEGEPAYQIQFPIPRTGGLRGFPDVAFNADPNTGQAFYDSTGYNGQKGWLVAGGTSVSTPQWAGIVALINEGLGYNLSSDELHFRLYDAAEAREYQRTYRDITSGSNGTCGAVCEAGPGYDFVSGLGAPRAKHLVPFAAEHERSD